MKILVLGDIHGRTIWKDIIEKENPDKIIFLGDYVSTHDNISADQQLSNLNNILNKMNSHQAKRIQKILDNKEQSEKILNSPQAQAIIKKLMG